jgi:hypothetical protein
LIDSNSIPRTERYSLTLRQLVQCGCQKTLIGSLISPFPMIAKARLLDGGGAGNGRRAGCA